MRSYICAMSSMLRVAVLFVLLCQLFVNYLQKVLAAKTTGCRENFSLSTKTCNYSKVWYLLQGNLCCGKYCHNLVSHLYVILVLKKWKYIYYTLNGTANNLNLYKVTQKNPNPNLNYNS